jgi:mRNA interferase MazF
MVIERGEIWWASLPEPDGSGSGGRRPVLVVQADAFNRSAIATTIIAILTGRLDRAEAPGNLLLTAKQTGLPRDSVVNVSQMFTVDKAVLTERVRSLPRAQMDKVDDGLTRVLGP